MNNDTSSSILAELQEILLKHSYELALLKQVFNNILDEELKEDTASTTGDTLMGFDNE